MTYRGVRKIKLAVVLWVAILSLFPAALWADTIFTYEEDFAATTYRDPANTTLDWNTTLQRLQLSRADSGNTKQINGAIALGSDNNLYFAWLDFREGIGDERGHIYLQKYDRNGAKLWTADKKVDSGGEPYISDDYFGTYPKIISLDSYLYVYWVFKGNLYLQKFDPAGNKQWDEDFQINANTTYVTFMNYGYLPAVVNSSQEIVFFWNGHDGLYRQKVNPAGTGSRIGDSVALLNLSYNLTPAVGIDAADNCYVAYFSYDLTGAWKQTLYVDKFDANGARIWSQPTELASTSASLFEIGSIALFTAGNGESYVTWSDYNTVTARDVFLQKIDAAGLILWPSVVKANTENTYTDQDNGKVRLGSDGNIYVSWEDQRAAGKNDIYVRSFNPQGAALINEQKVNQGDNDSGYADWKTGFNSDFVMDTANELYVAWYAYRNQDYDLYWQKVSSDGIADWSSDVAVTTEEAGGGYLLSGQAQSLSVDLNNENIISAKIDFGTNFEGTTHFYISNDGGITWIEALNGSSVIFSTSGSDLRWKAEFSSSDIFVSPVISYVQIEYSTTELIGAYHKVCPIYDDSWRYNPSGWMAENNRVDAMTITESPNNPATGTSCVKITYDPNLASWVGFFVQASNKWRADGGTGIDLTGYSALIIKARTEATDTGAFTAQFGVGGDNGDLAIGGDEDTCSATTNWLTLTAEWSTFVIDLRGKNLSDINGLVMVNIKGVNKDIKPTIYIDDIKYVGTGPANISDLQPSIGPQPGELILSWTAPSGDYSNTSYVVKYSLNYIYNQIDFDSAATYTQSWTPSAPGTVESKVLTGLTPGQSYYFALETIDSEGNQSGLSNICYALASTSCLGILVNGIVDLGEMTAGETKSGGPISVTNIGGIPMTASLSITNPPGWTADSNNNIQNHYVLLGAFAESESAVSWDVVTQVLTKESVKCTSTRFAGDLTGVAVPVDAVRNLWIRFTAPRAYDIGTARQEIIINVTAGAVD